VLYAFGDGRDSRWVLGFGSRFGAELHLDGDAGSFIWRTLSGYFSSLDHGGRQMLGLGSRGLASPKNEGGSNEMKVFTGVQRHV
jgi:hypothetical protein